MDTNLSKRIEGTIYCMYYENGCKTQIKQMEKLKTICMNEINSLDGLEEELKKCERKNT